MKTKYFFIYLIMISNMTPIFGQKGPLFGSGKIQKFDFDFTDFNKVDIKDFDGNIEIEIGKEYSIHVEIDDNLAPRLRAEMVNNELRMWLFENTNGRLYLEATNIKIKVNLPFLQKISHRGNTNLRINGVKGKTFDVNHSGNGNVDIVGKVDMIDIHKDGNGNVDARNVQTLSARVKSSGNGDVFVNAKVNVTANGNGNGSILQFGEGKIDLLSGVIGNGSVRRAN